MGNVLKMKIFFWQIKNTYFLLFSRAIHGRLCKAKLSGKLRQLTTQYVGWQLILTLCSQPCPASQYNGLILINHWSLKLCMYMYMNLRICFIPNACAYIYKLIFPAKLLGPKSGVLLWQIYLIFQIDVCLMHFVLVLNKMLTLCFPCLCLIEVRC